MTTPHPDYNLPSVVNVKYTPFQDGDVYIGRSGTGSPWGNPWPVTANRTRAQAISMFGGHLLDHPELVKQLHDLNPKRLRCHCKPLACHGDVLVEALKEYRRNLAREAVTDLERES